MTQLITIIKNNLSKFVILIASVMGLFFLIQFLGFNSISLGLRLFISRFYIWGPLYFILSFIIGTIFFVPGILMTMLGGILFGTFEGGLYVIGAATIGSYFAFIIARKLGRGFVEALLTEETFKETLKYNNRLASDGFNAMIYLRLMPLYPFNGLNFSLALTRVSRTDYIKGTLVGIIPGVFAYAFLGNALVILSIWKILFGILFLIGLALVTQFYYKVVKNIPSEERVNFVINFVKDGIIKAPDKIVGQYKIFHDGIKGISLTRYCIFVKKINMRILIYLINLVFGLAEVILGLRFLLKLFGANPGASFASWIYEVTAPLLQPIIKIFPASSTSGVFTVEFTALFGLVFFALSRYLLIQLVIFIDRVSRNTEDNF